MDNFNTDSHFFELPPVFQVNVDARHISLSPSADVIAVGNSDGFVIVFDIFDTEKLLFEDLFDSAIGGLFWNDESSSLFILLQKGSLVEVSFTNDEENIKKIYPIPLDSTLSKIKKLRFTGLDYFENIFVFGLSCGDTISMSLFD